MRSRLSRIVVAMTLFAGGGFMMLSPNLGCESFAMESAMTAVDFCFIFDCTNGMFGGTIKPCQEGMGLAGGGTGPLFLDCPDEAQNP